MENIKETIAKLEKGLDNPYITDDIKVKISEKITELKAELEPKPAPIPEPIAVVETKVEPTLDDLTKRLGIVNKMAKKDPTLKARVKIIEKMIEKAKKNQQNNDYEVVFASDDSILISDGNKIIKWNFTGEKEEFKDEKFFKTLKNTLTFDVVKANSFDDAYDKVKKPINPSQNITETIGYKIIKTLGGFGDGLSDEKAILDSYSDIIPQLTRAASEPVDKEELKKLIIKFTKDPNVSSDLEILRKHKVLDLGSENKDINDVDDEIKKAAEFYFSDKYNLTKYDLYEDLVRYVQMEKDFNAKKLTPKDIIGTGHKPQYAREIASKWIKDRLELTKYLINNFDDKNKLTETQKQEQPAAEPIKELYLKEIAERTALRKEAIQNFATANGLTNDNMLDLIQGLGSKIITPIDLSTAISGTKGNAYEVNILNWLKNKPATEKLYYTQNNIGKAKYVVNYHDGVKTHKDGGAFYDIKIFKNKKDFENFIKKLESEGYKEKYEKGGETDIQTNSRMYNFLKDDLEKLEKAINEDDKEQVETFFSYWNHHLDKLRTETNDRMYNFLKDDLEKLENAINEDDKEELETFFSYWNHHLESLKMEQGGEITSEYYIHEGHDHFKNKPLFRVESSPESDNEYVGEWHDNRPDAQKELDGLNGKGKSVNYEVFIDMGKKGKRIIADFTKEQDAKNFVFEYGLKHPNKKLGIDTVSSDFIMEEGGEIPYKLHYVTYYKLPNGKWEVPSDSMNGIKYAIFNDEQSARDYIAENKEIKAKGGEVAADRMYNFLKDDLQKLETAINEDNKEEIERFFSYWNHHLDKLKTETNDRMYNFLKDDLEELETAINEDDKEEIERFFSYWNHHLEKLKMAKGGSTYQGGGAVKTVSVKSITDKYTYMKDRLKGIKGNVDIVIVDRDTSGMTGNQDPYMMEIHQNGKKIADYGTVPSKIFAKGGEVNDYPNATEKSLKEIKLLLSKGYDIDFYSNKYSDLVFSTPDEKEFIFATQGSKNGEYAVAYLYQDEDSGEMSISIDLLKEISDKFKNEPIKLFTNAGVDLHSSKKGKYKNVEVIKVGIDKFENGGEAGLSKINFNHFKLNELESFIKLNEASGDVDVTVSTGSNLTDKAKTYTNRIPKQKIQDLVFSIGDVGKEINILKGSENIYADFVVYDEENKPYTISISTKENHGLLKLIAKQIIEKFENGGEVINFEGIRFFIDSTKTTDGDTLFGGYIDIKNRVIKYFPYFHYSKKEVESAMKKYLNTIRSASYAGNKGRESQKYPYLVFYNDGSEQKEVFETAAVAQKFASVLERIIVTNKPKLENGGETFSIDFTKQKEDIINFHLLPKEVQDLIKNTPTIRSSGFRELHGLDGRKLLWSASGSWWSKEDVKKHKKYKSYLREGFELESIGAGSGNLQWSEGKPVTYDKFAKGGSAWIQKATKQMDKKGTKGLFTERAEARGLTAVEFAKKVLANPKRYTQTIQKEAQFVKNTNPELFN